MTNALLLFVTSISTGHLCPNGGGLSDSAVTDSRNNERCASVLSPIDAPFTDLTRWQDVLGFRGSLDMTRG